MVLSTSCDKKKESFSVIENTIGLIPLPNKMEWNEQQFNLNDQVTIYYPGSNKRLKLAAEELQSSISMLKGVSLKLESISGPNEKGIALKVDPSIANQHHEAYQIIINDKNIEITGASEKGTYYGVQTMIQLINISEKNGNSIIVPGIKIIDSPRFEYRAMMLDPARHFIPAGDIKKYIDAIAHFKFNTLHLHLADDQGWRVEIKKYPKLMEISSKRKETEGDGTPHEGYYTQEELKDLVAYAKSKFINIIPEIDVPGHSQALVAAYPELTCIPR